MMVYNNYYNNNPLQKKNHDFKQVILIEIIWRCPWCNGYRCKKRPRQHEFKTWMRLIAFHIALITLRKV